MSEPMHDLMNMACVAENAPRRRHSVSVISGGMPDMACVAENAPRREEK